MIRLSSSRLLATVFGSALVAGAALHAQGPLPPQQAFAALAPQPATQTAFTVDRNMLQSADGFFQSNDPETERVVAGLNSITVRNFHFNDFANYSPTAFAALDAQYRAAGWKHLVNTNRNSATTTDLWLHLSGMNITNVTVLNRGERNMNVVSVDCTLRPLDLLHLAGHFGIPRVDPNAIMVPAQ